MRIGNKQANKPRRGARRASFQPDAPVISFQQQATWQAGSDQANDHLTDPWQTPFIPQPQDWFLQDEIEPVYAGMPKHATITPPAKRLGRGWLLAALISLAGIALCAYLVINAYQGKAAFENKLSKMQQNTFANGVVVDGIPLGGATMEQARAATMQQAQDTQQPLRLVLNIDSATVLLTAQQIPFERNTEAILEKAWSLGRRGMRWGISSGLTPFEIRYRHILQLQKDHANFATQVTFDPARVREVADSIALQINTEAINAVIEQFNFDTREFTVTQDVPGRRIAASQIESAILSALQHQQYSSTIKLSTTAILPKVTSVDLRNNFTQLASFSTKTSSDQARNNNIKLAAQAISNRSLLPGETFSFNEATGKRTMEKGYQGAPAIAGGVLIDDVGGGVCQVSSTLFYAAALADMTIVDRSPHAWPVSYMDKGLDATVNWPNLDFKFRNDRDTPVFIVASYHQRQLTVDIYGMRIAPGEAIRLETELLSTTKPPREPTYQQNPSLALGTTRELKPARTGYEVATFRVYLRNGVEYRRDRLFVSNYRMVQQVMEYN